jgi:isoquinoline 1-oxidoreductase beta subunit
MPVTWEHYIASQSIGGGAGEMTAGASDLPYQIQHNVRASVMRQPIPVGYWRSVYNPPNAFANECFVDEIAAASDKDPYELRIALLNDTSRLKAVLKVAAERAGWGTPLPKGSGRGIACHITWGVTYVAQVVELTVDDEGSVRVQRVVCAVDCGLAINPDGVQAQMEGGIVFGIGAALKGEITFKDGQSQQHTLRDYPLLRFDEMPQIDVYIVPSDNSPTGIGEMGNPPTTPAILNAIFAATGKRIRRLPVRPDDLVQV